MANRVMTSEEAAQLAKDMDLMDLLRRTIKRAMHRTALERRLEALEREEVAR